MIRFLLALIAACALMSFTSNAHSAVTATWVSGNATATVNNPSTGVWDVVINIPPQGFFNEHEWIIEADDFDKITQIVVFACESSTFPALKPLYLTIRSVGVGAIAELGDIKVAGGGSGGCAAGASVVIDLMTINGDITGDIAVQGIRNAFVSGDLLGTINLGPGGGEPANLYGID